MIGVSEILFLVVVLVILLVLIGFSRLAVWIVNGRGDHRSS